ncbi:MAG: hypoxanthine phosphoribosyltransferase [Planctomycetes bacterium]|nr:hypoxanthine phosphoribosyltransferase [Planctomycetota bacterium]MBT7011416.1 hypoxanthine phosphoribosyltransferase [Planctomycetota bacterium]
MERYRRRLLMSRQDLEAGLKGMAERLAPVLGDDEVTAIPVLGGAMFFAADLVRHMPSGLVMDFIRIQTYGDSTSPQSEAKVDWVPHESNVRGKHVLLLDDILDTGRTLFEAKRYLLDEMGAAKVTIAVLIDKPIRRSADVSADCSVLLMEDDAFLVGYGLDFAGRFRNVPDVYALETGPDGLPLLAEEARDSISSRARGPVVPDGSQTASGA